MPIGKQQQHPEKPSNRQILENFRSQVLDKKQHTNNAIGLRLGLLKLQLDLHNAEENTKGLHATSLFDGFNNNEQAENYTPPHRPEEIKKKISETQASLAAEVQLTRLDTAKTISMWEDQTKSLDKLIKFLDRSLKSEHRATMNCLARDIKDGNLTISNAEHHGDLADKAQAMNRAGYGRDAILNNCYGLEYCFAEANFKPSSVVRSFVVSGRSKIPTLRRKVSLPGNRARVAKRMASTHGAATKAGDDGDGGDGDDGEPPRPHSSYASAPLLHSLSLTHSLIAGGAQ